MSNGAREFDWEGYIEFAKSLLSNRASEAAKRSAISRSYYGAFILARNLAFDKGWLKESYDRSIHHLVIHYYTSHCTHKIRQIGNNLDRLRLSRNDADYNNIFEGLDDQTKISIRRAEHIKNSLRTL